MNTKEIIDNIEKMLTGDPQKDGPFLKDQSEKYRDSEESEEINRELARLLFEVAKKDHDKTLDAFLSQENPKVNEQIETVKKRYDNRNYSAGMKILEEIMKNNMFSWLDTNECTYKSFGTPLEFMLYNQLYQPEKEVKPITCNLAGAYWLYGHGLMKKKKYSRAKEMIERATELNPVDPDAYIQLCEVLKYTKDADELKEACDKLLKCAVSKEQVGKAYFNYSFYFSEKQELEKAAMMLEMSRIFYSSDIQKTEYEYLSQMMGAAPPRHTSQELMNMMSAENIQPGPSAAVVQSAYALAKEFETQLELSLAKYFYEIVFELTEDSDTGDHIEELARDIKNMKN